MAGQTRAGEGTGRRGDFDLADRIDPFASDRPAPRGMRGGGDRAKAPHSDNLVSVERRGVREGVKRGTNAHDGFKSVSRGVPTFFSSTHTARTNYGARIQNVQTAIHAVLRFFTNTGRNRPRVFVAAHRLL